MDTREMNRAAAIRFIEAFNTGAWDDLPTVVAGDFVLHHPMGGTMRLGPQGMHQVWSHFKAALPDAWHPIPVMIAEGDYVAPSCRRTAPSPVTPTRASRQPDGGWSTGW